MLRENMIAPPATLSLKTLSMNTLSLANM